MSQAAMTGVTSTTVFGVPVPSTDPIFLGIVIVHIAFGLCAVLTGLGAMFSRKERGRHSTFGTAYFWSLAGVFATMTVLSVMRWPEDYPLFLLGASSFSASVFGRFNIRARRPRWHLAAMGASYILMLTAFYVDNGRNLPVWRALPHAVYWIVSAAVGMPIIFFYLFRLPRFSYSRR